MSATNKPSANSSADRASDSPESDVVASIAAPAPHAVSGAAPRAQSPKNKAFLAQGSNPDNAPGRILLSGRILIGLITIVMFGLLARVAQLQTQPPAPIAKLVNSQNSAVTLVPRRGSIIDRHGRPLGGTLMAKRLFVDPQLIKDPGTFSERVGYGLNYNPAQVERAISARLDSRYIVIDSVMTPERYNKVASLNLPALGIDQHPIRDYPMGHLAGQLIGFVGVDNKGLDGLEQSLNSKLTGQPGRLGYWRDARRNPIWVDQDQYQPPVDGQTVRLTLDAVIQGIAETQLKKAVDEFQADSGQIIIMQPATGHILAMANYPFFDPTNYRTADPEIRRNRNVTDSFEPGSTFKPFVWAAATELGLANPQEKIDTTTSGVFVLPYRRRLHDSHPHGVISWEEVLVTSSNIGMAKVAMRMEPSQLYTAVRAFGFGDKPGSRLPGETDGILHPLKKWSKYSMSSIPMGHEIAVTPLQLARGFSALANDGVLVTPRVIMRLDDAPLPVGVRILSSQTAQKTKAIMRRVITEGTGRRAESKHYTLFGKTGTAQVNIPGQGGYRSGQYVANFIAAAPLDNPQIVVLCVIHKPNPKIGHYGGTVAGPTVKAVIEEVLPYLGIAPDIAPAIPAPPGTRGRLAQRD